MAVRRHPLYLLNDLRRVTEHRHPHVTGAIAEVHSIGISEMWGVDLAVGGADAIPAGVFYDGAILYRAQCRVSGNKAGLYLEVNPKFDVAFDPEGPAMGAPVVTTLRELHAYVASVVLPALEAFVI